MPTPSRAPVVSWFCAGPVYGAPFNRGATASWAIRGEAAELLAGHKDLDFQLGEKFYVSSVSVGSDMVAVGLLAIAVSDSRNRPATLPESPAQRTELKPGMTRDQLLSALGTPLSEVSFAERTRLTHPGMVVLLEENKLVTVDGSMQPPAGERSLRRARRRCFSQREIHW